MKPYYQDDYCTIYHGDCREVLPLLSGIDLVVTDPPYGIADKPNTFTDRPGGRRGPRGGRVNTWHDVSDWDLVLDPSWLPLALTKAPIVALFGHWRKRVEFETACGFQPRAEIVWVKDMHCGPPCPAAMRDERIWVFSESGISPLRFETTVWEVSVIPTWSKKDHKNEKPLALMTRLLMWLPGETVLDPFMGSGTTLRAAKDIGRKAVGIELSEKHCETAAKRLRQDVLPFAAA